jgi:hypothetical protein
MLIMVSSWLFIGLEAFNCVTGLHEDYQVVLTVLTLPLECSSDTRMECTCDMMQNTSLNIVKGMVLVDVVGRLICSLV